MSIKQITQLPASTTLASTDVLAKETSGNTTQKITAQDMANYVKTLANLQEALTFDTTPTTGSTNPVTSGGIATAIAQSTANLIKYETHSFTNISFASGAAGSRGAQYSFTFTAGTIVGITIIRIEDSSVMIPVPFVYYPNTVYLNVYRASSGATSNNRVDIRIAYI